MSLRPKLLWGAFPIARVQWLTKLYTRCGWYGVGIGKSVFIGVQIWTPRKDK